MNDQIPLQPPIEWFTPPKDMPKDAGCIVESNGRIFGYLCHWGTVLMDGSHDRWQPPRSKNAYAFAHTGDTKCEDGTILKTANLGGDMGHAPTGANDLAATQQFYENTQTQLARIRYGEDENGVWFAGACWPNISEFDIAKLRASARSGHWAAVGDWRDMHSGRAGYELVGACLVNVPGLKYARADRAASGVLSFNPVNMASGANHTGAMVALFLEGGVAKRLAVAGGEPAHDLHITLAYFHDAGNERDDWDAIHTLVANIGAKHLPLGGKVQGRGEFYVDDGGVVHYASPDVPGIGALRHELATALADVGFDVREDHGFTPHITLRYDDDRDESAPDVGMHTLAFDRLTLAVGGDMTKLGTKTAQPRLERVASSGTVALAAGPSTEVGIEGVLVVEGSTTEDGRLIELDAVSWRELPLPLYSSLANLPGHDEADLVGRIDTIWRDETDPSVVRYSGVLFPDAAGGAGQATIDAIENKSLRGVSIDGVVGPNDSYFNEDDVSVMSRIVIAGATLTPMPAISGATVTLLQSNTEDFAMADVESDVTVDDQVDGAVEVIAQDDDRYTALSDQISALSDRVEFLIGLVENWQMDVRYEAAAAKVRK